MTATHCLSLWYYGSPSAQETSQKCVHWGGSNSQHLTTNCNHSLLARTPLSLSLGQWAPCWFPQNNESRALRQPHPWKLHLGHTEQEIHRSDQERCSPHSPDSRGTKKTALFGLPQNSRPVHEDLLTYVSELETLPKQKISMLAGRTCSQSLFWEERQAQSQNQCEQTSPGTPMAGVILGWESDWRVWQAIKGTSGGSPNGRGQPHSLSHDSCVGWERILTSIHTYIWYICSPLCMY